MEAAYYLYNGQATISTFEGVDNAQDCLPKLCAVSEELVRQTMLSFVLLHALMTIVQQFVPAPKLATLEQTHSKQLI